MSDTKPQISQFEVREAQYFKEMNEALNLTTEEIAMLERNGFVVLDRLRFKQFKRAYAWI